MMDDDEGAAGSVAVADHVTGAHVQGGGGASGRGCVEAFLSGRVME